MKEPKKNIADIRKEYALTNLDITQVIHNPLSQLEKWVQEAIDSQVQEPTAMVLSTVSDDKKPSSRVLLLKGINENGLVFFTNYHSRKGKQLEVNPFGAINFFWPELERQVRIEGKLEKVSTHESDEYFASRPRGSQVGATVSPQSEVIPNRKFLEDKAEDATKLWEGKNIPRPIYWGGYVLIPSYFEFWQGRPSRLHDRIIYELETGKWKINRLAP
jgi:pyridoxamine 5'-phosphate oxidase